MKKKVTNEQVGQFIGDIVEIVNKEREEEKKEYNLARCQMFYAESVLVNSLTQDQLELHKIYREKRDSFFNLEKGY